MGLRGVDMKEEYFWQLEMWWGCEEEEVKGALGALGLVV